MFPMPDDYDDPLASLTDEERKRFLEGYAPSPVHTGAMARGAQGFAPLPTPRGAIAPDREGLVSSASPPADDLMARFMAAQQKGAGNASFANLGGRLDNYARVFAGVPEREVDTTSMRQRPVADLMAQEGLKQQERQRTRQTELDAVNLDKTRAETTKAQASARATEAEEKREAALADSKSPESSALRDTATSLLVDEYGKPTISPEKLAGMSGQQIREALKFGTSRLNADAQAFIGQQRVNNDRHATEVAAALRSEGLDTQYSIAELMAAIRESEGTKDRASQEELARQRLAAEQAKTARERGEKLEEREVGGWEFAPGRTPSPEGYKTMAAAALQIGRIERSLANLRSLYAQHGTQLLGTKAGLMESEFMAITNAARVMNDMGVPNGKDYEMLAKEIQDPTTLKDLFTSKGRSLGKMDLMGRRMQALADDTAKVYGYLRAASQTPTMENSGSPEPSRAPIKSSTTGGKVTLHWSTGGTTEVAAARAQKLVKEQPERFSLKPFPPEKVRKKQYSKARNQTRTVDGNGKVLLIEDGDTSGK